MVSQFSKGKIGGYGLNIFYFGRGKGKTTAAMGLAARAAGAGMDVFILQFVKAPRPAGGKTLQGGEWPVSSEILFFESVRGSKGKIGTAQVGAGFVGILGDRKARAVHVREAERGLALAKKIIASKKYGVVILDELLSAVDLKLLSEADVLALIKSKPPSLHLAYTGHRKYVKIVAVSDVATEMKMVAHPYYSGMVAQRGIDF
jgi:cob(I)alamin adenosyltransferase